MEVIDWSMPSSRGGDEKKIRERIQAVYDAGANHVCILPLKLSGGLDPDQRTLEALAP